MTILSLSSCGFIEQEIKKLGSEKLSLDYVILGQSDKSTIKNYHYSITYPTAVKFVGNKVLALSGNEYRLLIWNQVPTSSGTQANVVVGERDFNARFSSAVNASTLSWTQHFDSDGTRLVIADTSNNRVLIWNTIPTTMGAAADLVLGQPNMTSNSANNGGISPSSLSGPQGVLIVGNKLVVMDNTNNRVLIWNSWPTANQAAADLVLGQPDFTSNAANNGGVSPISLKTPRAAYFDGTSLFITDNGNHRVLKWNSWPSANQQAADIVLGQSNFTTNAANSGGIGPGTLSAPAGIRGYGTVLAVADTNNHRVLIWNTIPTANKQNADVVVGQPNFTTNTCNVGGNTAQDFCRPYDVSYDGTRFAIADLNNSRILIWNALPTGNYTGANLVLGQSATTIGYPSAIWGKNPIESPATLRRPAQVKTAGVRFLLLISKIAGF